MIVIFGMKKNLQGMIIGFYAIQHGSAEGVGLLSIICIIIYLIFLIA